MTPPETNRRHCEKTLDSGTNKASSGPPRERSGRAAMLTVLAVAAIGVAGMVAYGYVRYRQLLVQAIADAPVGPAQPAASAPAPSQPAAKAAGARRAVSAAPDKAETRTPLVLIRAGKEGETRPVVALGRPEGIKKKEHWQGSYQSIVDRELVRQALLIAARDELGLPTRDELLDDVPPGKADGAPVELATLFRPGECHALVRRGEGAKAEVIQKYDLGTNPDAGQYTIDLTALAEALSRSEFPALLKQLGLKGAPNQVAAAAPVPPDVENRLEQLGFVDQVAALRALHEAIRTDGESPARLAALARAYAQLGVLSEYQWSPAHRAFKARALLYAERLVARDPKSALALRSRAFVRALVGRHDLALADLDEAKKLDNGTRGAAPAPSWLPFIDAYLKADRKALAIKDGPHARLAALLNMMTVEYPVRTRARVDAAREVVSRDADCCGAYDAICESGQLGDLHIATQIGPDAFTKLFPVKLKSLPALPATLGQPLEKNGDELTLLGALDQAGRPGDDAGEPSWAVLAHLAREARFVHAWRRLDFMAHKWAVPVGEYFDDIEPFVARHRYYAFLQSIALPPQQGQRELAALADRLDLNDIEPTERPLVDALKQLKHPAGDAAWAVCFNHCGILARDIAERIQQGKDRREHFARLLLRISPYSAYAMGTLVEANWDEVKNEVPAWRAKVGDAPALIGALGRKHFERKEYDEAEKDLKRYKELCPDLWVYERLASCYEARGDRERWKETLDDYLANTEDSGLQHAQVRVQLANYLMTRERWADAKKYAEPAAETWAGWAMICASRCNEGLEDWERAELWIRRTAERYPTSSWAAWYLFCRRTGHGDVEAARAMAEEYLTAVEGRPDLAGPHQLGFFQWATGSPKKALENLEKAEAAKPSPLHAFSAMLLADELGDKARRDRMLNELCAKFQDRVPRMVALARMIREAHTDGGEHPLDLAAVDKVLERMPANMRGNAEFLIGKYLLNRGQAEAARKYLQYASNAPETQAWLKVIAVDSLRSMDAKKGR